MRQFKMLKYTTSIVLATAITLGLVGCNGLKANEVTVEPMEAEEVVAYSFDAIGGSDVMPILGYYGPRPTTNSVNGNDEPDWYTDEAFALIAGTGLNMISCNYTYYELYPELLDKMMQFAEKNNIGITVNDRRLISVTEDVEDYAVDQFVKDYVDYPAYCGNYIVDEPDYIPFRGAQTSVRQLSNFAPIFTKLNKLGYFGYGSLFPKWGGNKENYKEYLETYVETCNPKVLSYDMYPFDENVGMARAAEYFDNMGDVRAVAEEAKIPFWTFVQAGAQWNDSGSYFDSEEYYPAKGEFLWMMGTSLAYGAKGIQYFPMIQPYKFANAVSTVADTQRNGLIGAYGNKTRWYYYAAEANEQIAAVDEVLMNAVNKGVIASGEDASTHLAGNPFLLAGTSWRELTGITGNALVGCFNYQGKTALYVVNYDTEYAQKIMLDFVDTYNITVTQNAKEKHMSTDSIELTFAAGDSALIVFE